MPPFPETREAPGRAASAEAGRGRSLLVVAGDASGDLHGSVLVRELKRRAPELTVAALGGKLMRAEADKFLFDLVSMGASGFAEPVRRFFTWTRRLDLVRTFLEKRRPDAVITIDFYGFNHQVLGLARHRDIPTLYFISPQIWASRAGRVRNLAKLVRHMLLIFPFELDLYRKAGVPCTFVGHPLLDRIPEPGGRPYDPERRVAVAILPGSRPSEVRKHTPLFLDAFALIRKELPQARARLFAANSISDELLEPLLEGRSDGVQVVRDDGYALRGDCDFALTSSGTATLENALLGVPMVVAYQLSWFTYAIAKAIVRVRWIAMANILAGRRLVPELIQDEARADRVAEEALSYLRDPSRLEELRAGLLGLRRSLGQPGACGRAADIILAHVRAAGAAPEGP